MRKYQPVEPPPSLRDRLRPWLAVLLLGVLPAIGLTKVASSTAASSALEVMRAEASAAGWPEISRRVLASTVAVVLSDGRHGSGFVVRCSPVLPENPDMGYLLHVVTCAHVTALAEDGLCSLVKDGAGHSAHLLWADQDLDVAVVASYVPSPWPVLEVATEPAEFGAEVVVVGFPIMHDVPSAVRGLIGSEFHSSALVAPGASGAPVVDVLGRVVGVEAGWRGSLVISLMRPLSSIRAALDATK